MRLQLMDPQYANFTGQIGALNFVDGLSVDGVAPQQAATLQAVVHATLVPEPVEEPAP